MASVRRQPNNVATAEGKSDKKPLVKSEEADSFRSIYDYLFDEVEWRLVATFFAVRGLVFFIVVPILQLCWNRAEFVDVSNTSTPFCHPFFTIATFLDPHLRVILK